MTHPRCRQATWTPSHRRTTTLGNSTTAASPAGSGCAFSEDRLLRAGRAWHGRVAACGEHRVPRPGRIGPRVGERLKRDVGGPHSPPPGHSRAQGPAPQLSGRPHRCPCLHAFWAAGTPTRPTAARSSARKSGRALHSLTEPSSLASSAPSIPVWPVQPPSQPVSRCRWPLHL